MFNFQIIELTYVLKCNSLFGRFYTDKHNDENCKETFGTYCKFHLGLLTDSTLTKTKEFRGIHFFLHNTGSVDPLIVWDAFKYSSQKNKNVIGQWRKYLQKK
jgi:hypothetical protein